VMRYFAPSSILILKNLSFIQYPRILPKI